MKRKIRYAFLALLLVGSLVPIGTRLASSSKRQNLGAVDGILVPCPSSPNCISTQAIDARHQMPPISYEGSAETAIEAITTTLSAMPRTRIVRESELYVHAEVSTLVFGFVDDVEFVVDAHNRLIHFRSASRLGHSDLGTNRARMEKLRTMIEHELDSRAASSAWRDAGPD